MNTPGTPNRSTLEVILDFLGEIGLETRPGTITEETILPGIDIVDGVIVWDESRLLYPGDLLHDAGHLAAKTPAERRATNRDTGASPAEEMTAIAWSYAAVVHLGLPVEVLFHPHGYDGGSASLIENFTDGRYFGVPMLEYYGLTASRKRAGEETQPVYPVMSRWVRTE